MSTETAIGAALTPQNLVHLYALMGQKIESQTSHRDALSGITRVASQVILNAHYVSISRTVDDGFRTEAPTDDAARQADQLQYAGSGPCIDAAVTDGVYQSGDLCSDSRWPVFGAQVTARTGIHSVLSIRLVTDQEDGFVASLNVYSRDREAFTDTSRQVATLLATHGGLAVSRLIAREKASKPGTSPSQQPSDRDGHRNIDGPVQTHRR
jgi:hypothetical protein